MLTGLHHVGYVVPDLDRAVEFYTKTLGLTLDRRVKGNAGPGVDFDVAVFKLGDGATAIEVIRPTTQTGPFAAYLKANPAGGLQHIAFSTRGTLEEAAEQVKRCGLSLAAFTANGPVETPTGWRIVNVDPAGSQGLLTQLGSW